MSRILTKSQFESLFRQLHGPLCRFCRQFVRNPVLAEEIVQEKFIYLWENRKTLKIRTSLEAFMYTAVKNQSIDYLRSRAARIDMEKQELPIDTKDSGDPLQEMEYKEFEKKINQAIEALPEKCYIVFSLKRFGELSNKEIAEKLNISEKTVLNQITKAKKLVKQALID